MAINVFGKSCSLHDNGSKIDTSLFVQKLYLRSNYTEANIEEDVDLKNIFGIKNLPDPISVREAASKNYVDNKFNDPSIIKNNNPQPDMNDKNIIKVGIIEVNNLPEIGNQLTPKL